MHLAKTTSAHALSAAMDVDESEGSTSGNLLTGEVSPLQFLGTATDNQGISTVLPDLDEFPASAQSPPTLLTRSGRPRREYRLPKRYHDNLPEPLAPALMTSNLDPELPHRIRRVILIVRDRLVTTINSFGIWRDYPERPSTDPDALLTLEDLSNAVPHHTRNHAVPSNSEFSSISSLPSTSHWPFSNPTTHSVMQWLNNGQTTKSEAETTKFIHDVVLSPTFNCGDLAGFDAHRENQRLDKALSQTTPRSQFIESSVEILVPSGDSKVEPKAFTIPGLLHRSITSVIREAFNSPLAHLHHYSPFKLFQKSPVSGKDERIYGEIFTSDAFLDETEKVHRHSQVPVDDSGCKREKVVAALMVSSDATMLTDFGTAKAWPVYLMLGNLSKYVRAQPNSGAMHHLAYIPSVSIPSSFKIYHCMIFGWQLPDTVREFISSFHPKWRTQKDSILTHCRRELMHAVWKKLLDDDFIYAYTYGIVIKCIDGIERRVYPRLFTYSADYPEK